MRHKRSEYGFVSVDCPMNRKIEKVPYRKIDSFYYVDICDDGCGTDVCSSCIQKIRKDLTDNPPQDFPLSPL